jgi:thiamine pyrophosphate-dependent acetolactate synthase large subunit-like protein
MPRDQVLQAIAPHVGTAIVVAVYQTCFDWMGINPRDLNYVATGAMGQASSHGLGLALGRPDKKVIVFDGDGSLLMNLGSLVTIANVAPPNFYHFLFSNGTYEVNGSHPVPGGEVTDYRGLAEAAGYRSSGRYADLQQFSNDLPGILSQEGPAFTELRIAPGKSYPRDYDTIHGADVRARFKAALAADRACA